MFDVRLIRPDVSSDEFDLHSSASSFCACCSAEIVHQFCTFIRKTHQLEEGVVGGGVAD